MRSAEKSEWSKFYCVSAPHGVEALHAHFVKHQYPRHTHEYFVVGLIDAGVQSYWYRGARHTTPAGKVFVVNPEEPHTGESATADGYVYRTLYPRSQDLARIANDIGMGAKTPFLKGAVLDDRILARLLARCHACIADRGAKVECESLFLRAMARLLTEHSNPQIALRPVGRERPAVTLALEYMEANFAGGVSLSDLALLVGLSPYYFARSFEHATGLPPHKYLEGIRIRKARELLSRGESLVSTALAVGYSDQSHLNHRFKRFLGITPGQYVREHASARRFE